MQKESAMAEYSTWYPPVQKTLLCLSKLYTCVEHKVFAGLAQDAIAACTEAVQVGLLCLLSVMSGLCAAVPCPCKARAVIGCTFCHV